MTRTELPNLDILRAVAVLLVLADHVLETIGHRSGVFLRPYDLYAGRLGVLLFFVHTSYVLMASMERLKLEGAALVRSFYLRRAFRIYPLAVLCVVIVVTMGVPELPWKDYRGPANVTLASNLALTMNLTYSRPLLGPLWSLPLELQMYVALPFIFMFLGPTRSIARWAWLYAASVAAALLVTPLSGRLDVAGFAPCFMAGVAAYALAGRVRVRIPGWAMLPFLGVTVVTYFALDDRINGIHPPALAWAICLFVGLGLPFIAQSTWSRLNAAAARIAKYSYGIYLFHCVALYWGLFALEAPAPVQWGVTLALLVVMSVAAFHWLERPAIALGARLAGTRHGA